MKIKSIIGNVKYLAFPMLMIGFIQIVPLTLFSQNKLDLSIEVNPFCIPFKKPLNQENGIGYYSAEVYGKTNNSFLVNFSWYLFDNFGLKLGAGYHNFRYEVYYNILDPLDETISFMENYRQFHTSDIGPTIGFVYNHNKLQLGAGVNMFVQHLEIYQSHNSSLSDNFFIDPDAQKIKVLRIREDIKFSYASSYNLVYLNIGYAIAKHIYLHVGYENSFSNGLPHLYELQVVGNTVNTTDEEHLLNDFAFLYKYSSINFGAYYTFNLKKGALDSQ
jgi:hypothetical protein